MQKTALPEMTQPDLQTKHSVIIIGAGPAGLNCARILAEGGKKVLLIEKKAEIGAKVCAGGITWSGLLKVIPDDLAEQHFPTQHIVTPLQRVKITEPEPIIATVNRQKVGAYMAKLAGKAGAELKTSCRLLRINNDNTLVFQDLNSGRKHTASYDFLVGADGSASKVRKHLGLPTKEFGIGINYQVPGHADRMEWHLDHSLFRNGYGWIFPHRDTISIGAYCCSREIRAKELNRSLVSWAGGMGYTLADHNIRAEVINFDYRGWKFGNIFLVGDAAGFASGLTGEGIYPAMVSGEHTARYILNPKHNMSKIERLIRMQKLHSSMVRFTRGNRFKSSIAAEFVTFCLRCRLIDFTKLEMAH